MSSSLELAPCPSEAASYAVEHWHYSKQIPTGRTVRVGVWEHGRFIGVVMFSRGASAPLYKHWGLPQTELCELSRIALDRHETPVSRIGAGALTILKEVTPSMRLVVSFADPHQGHHGGIYQAMNFTYLGISADVDEFYFGGKWRHTRSVSGVGSKGWLLRQHYKEQGGDLPRRRRTGKHRYAYPLDRGMRRRLNKLAQPYPVKP